MRMKKLTPQIRQYLIKVYGQYEEGKLSYPEQVQLFQDLWDTGLVFDMGPEVLMFAQRLLRVNLIKGQSTGNDNAN
jgi:hypothetical protein